MIGRNELMTINADEYQDEYDHVGLRIVDIDYNDYNAIVGDTLTSSYVWDDGDYTNERLPGVSAIDIDGVRYLPYFGGYMGNRVLVIGSNTVEQGADAEEVVMSDAVVLAVIDF